jgi:hypothetical protein
MVRRRFSAVSNHEAPMPPILRDAASRLLWMRENVGWAKPTGRASAPDDRLRVPAIQDHDPG